MRGGSKGVLNKNIRPMLGKPLLAYTIDQALGSKLFDRIAVSTDSKEIGEASVAHGADTWFLRPPELATDDAPKVPAIRHAFLEAERAFNQLFDVVVDLDVTSPLRKISDIRTAYQQFNKEASDNLITGCIARRSPYFNMVERKNGRIQLVKEHVPPIVRRQDSPEVYDMNASIYIWRREVLLQNNSLFLDRTSLFVMPEERSIDIDTEFDWKLVEMVLRERVNMSND
jgi:CMP-N,N'-diacetyllegionaminic acid synthase